MQGFEVKFNVYADSKDEAEMASAALRSFVDGYARRGIAVTANKIVSAVNKWKENIFVTNYFK